MLDNLVIAIDLSEDGPRTIALVGVKEHVLKSRLFSRLFTGLRHFRRVSPDRRASYLRFFSRRYLKLREMISLARITHSINTVENLLHRYEPVVIIIDNKLNRYISYEPKILESAPKPKYMDNLVIIADNLANYFRLLLKDNPRKFREELRRFEK